MYVLYNQVGQVHQNGSNLSLATSRTHTWTISSKRSLNLWPCIRDAHKKTINLTGQSFQIDLYSVILVIQHFFVLWVIKFASAWAAIDNFSYSYGSAQKKLFKDIFTHNRAPSKCEKSKSMKTRHIHPHLILILIFFQSLFSDSIPCQTGRRFSLWNQLK